MAATGFLSRYLSVVDCFVCLSGGEEVLVLFGFGFCWGLLFFLLEFL